MMIYEITNKYYIWKSGNQYIVTTRKRAEVFSGTLEECHAFIERHPHGITARER